MIPARNFKLVQRTRSRLSSNLGNPLTPRTDKDRISPYSINTVSTR